MRAELLVLWDVDHTLIETGGVGREAFADAFQRLTGCPLTAMAPVAGRTEPDILRSTLLLHDLEPSDSTLAAFEGELAEAYRRRIGPLRRRGRALPGALTALTALAADDRVVQSVLTGNFRAVATLKLAAFKLERHLDAEVGAYGSDHAVRPRLVGIARERASSAYGRSYGPDSTVLVGDTPSDVRTGMEGGARVVAVASGTSSVDELHAAGAAAVLADLTDTAALLRLVTGRGKSLTGRAGATPA